MAVSQNQPISRPSFYATIRLARLVLGFRERLKSKIKLRHSSAEAFAKVQIKGFKAHAYDDLDRALRSNDDSRTSEEKYRKYGRSTGSDLGISVLLNDLDSHATPGQLPLRTIAAQDQLFLEHGIHHFASFKTIEIKHTLDVTTLLLERLHQRQGSHVEEPDEDLNFAKYNANLEHLLLCLQAAALAALIHLSLKLVEAEALRWSNFRRKLAQVIDGWFAEWPNGRHPLSTTWPWNIKPSLVILWGVCWMFYDAQMWMPNGLAESGQFSEGLRTRRAPLPIASQQDAGTWTVSDIHTPSISSQSQWQLPADLDTRRANCNSDYPPTLPDGYNTTGFQNSYIFSPTVSSDRFPAPLISQPHIQGNNSFPISDPDYPFEPGWPSISQSQAFIDLVEATAPSGQIGYTGPNVQSNRQATPFLESTRNVSQQSGLQLPTCDMQDYPSPGSEYSRQRKPSCSPVSPSIAIGPGMPSAASPSTSPQSRQEENRKSRELTKNAEGNIYCAHPSCERQPPTFARKCEWSKHMDKHDRPYVCEEPGCEKIQGFTYSGGLLRHQREVHRQHGGPKATCMCPYRDCKRSTGVGFSRKENLSEHLRRVHRGIGEHEKAPVSSVHHQSLDENALTPMTSESRKRNKSSDHPEDERGIMQEPQKRRRGQDKDIPIQRELVGQPQNLQQQVENLARELHTCQDKIRRLEQTVQQLAGAQHIRV